MAVGGANCARRSTVLRSPLPLPREVLAQPLETAESGRTSLRILVGGTQVDELREEILQSQQLRGELLKWKLGLVGVIGAAGLGFAGSKRLSHADLVLCAIPPVCVYADLLCRHLALKIYVIGTFLRQWKATGDSLSQRFAAYEAYADRARRLPSGRKDCSAYDLEDWAVSMSTYALSVAIICYSIFSWVNVSPGVSVPFVVSGLVGLVSTWYANRIYRSRFREVNALANQPEQSPSGGLRRGAS
jgi:hypothetical protein